MAVAIYPIKSALIQLDHTDVNVQQVTRETRLIRNVEVSFFSLFYKNSYFKSMLTFTFVQLRFSRIYHLKILQRRGTRICMRKWEYILMAINCLLVVQDTLLRQ